MCSRILKRTLTTPGDGGTCRRDLPSGRPPADTCAHLTGPPPVKAAVAQPLGGLGLNTLCLAAGSFAHCSASPMTASRLLRAPMLLPFLASAPITCWGRQPSGLWHSLQHSAASRLHVTTKGSRCGPGLCPLGCVHCTADASHAEVVAPVPHLHPQMQAIHGWIDGGVATGAHACPRSRELRGHSSAAEAEVGHREIMGRGAAVQVSRVLLLVEQQPACCMLYT